MKLFQQKKQETVQTREHGVLYLLLSFLIPYIIMMAALAGLKIAPFGDNTLIISDGNGLYLNFLSYVGRAVKGQEGILFSFEKGLGGNMMGSWAWFLLNPFFALFSLFDIAKYPSAYTYVSILNMSACGFTMYLLLKDMYGHRMSSLIFSTSYALNGFLVANVFQMNFFTGVFALPIMVLGLRRILNGQNPVVYILSLAYSLLMNFYFGFMLCAASLLIFSAFYTADYPKLKNRKQIAVTYIVSSLLAGGLSSIVWLPALLSMRGGRLDQSVAYAISFSENMPFLDMAAKLFTGANTTAELSNGLPNIFVGILPLALVILFFMNRKTDRRRKNAAGFLLVVYLLSFYIRVFNLIMHGGTVTNWFNYRDSFVFSFLLLMIAAEQWQHLEEVPKEHFKRTGIFLLIGVLIVFSKSFEFVVGGAVLLDLLLLILMYLAWRMHRKDPVKNPKRIFAMLALVLVSLNLFLNYYFCTKNIQAWDEKKSAYQKMIVPVSALVDAVKQSDHDFYRMELGEQHSGNLGNDPMLYGYNGVGHGGSDDRDFVRGALNKLGIHRYDMRNSYGKGISAATDTLLGLKYLISKENLTEEKGYEKLVEIGDYSLYRNHDALPIAVLSGAGVGDVETGFEDVFENLNAVWAAISDRDKPVFHEETNISFISHNITDPLELSRSEAAQIVQKRDANIGPEESGSQDDQESATTSEEKLISILDMGEGSLKEMPDNVSSIQYIWKAARDGAAYSYNRSGVVDNRGSSIPALIADGYHHAGDTISAYLPMENSLVTKYVLEDVAGRFRAAYADNDALHELATIVKNRPCTIEKVKDSHLRGEFTAEAGQKLMFTIPYDEGWTCYIDGQEAEIKMVLGVFMAVDVPEGTHSYEMKFFPTGMKTGIGLSTAALLTTLVYIPVDARRRKRAAA